LILTVHGERLQAGNEGSFGGCAQQNGGSNGPCTSVGEGKKELEGIDGEGNSQGSRVGLGEIVGVNRKIKWEEEKWQL